MREVREVKIGAIGVYGVWGMRCEEGMRDGRTKQKEKMTKKNARA